MIKFWQEWWIRNEQKNIYKNLKKKIQEIRELKYKVKEQMIKSEKSEEVTQWSADLENIAKTVTASAVIK